MGTHKYSTAQIEQQIDSILIGVLRVFILVFFLAVAVISFAFAVFITGLCFTALVLKAALHLVARKPETSRLFAVAGSWGA